MKITLLSAAVLAAAFAGSTAISSAATAYSAAPLRASYDTSMSPLSGIGLPWTGTLQLTITPDNIINGYYRPNGDGNYVPVTGGRDGNDVWLDIGTSGRIHVTGSLTGGTISGMAFDDRSRRSYRFSAKVEA